MNARQKAKHYKKLYETSMYNVPHKKIKCDGRIVKKIKIKQCVEESVITQISADEKPPLYYVQRKMCRSLSEEIMKYMTYELESCEIPYHVNLVGTVEVLTNERIDFGRCDTKI